MIERATSWDRIIKSIVVIVFGKAILVESSSADLLVSEDYVISSGSIVIDPSDSSEVVNRTSVAMRIKMSVLTWIADIESGA